MSSIMARLREAHSLTQATQKAAHSACQDRARFRRTTRFPLRCAYAVLGIVGARFTLSISLDPFLFFFGFVFRLRCGSSADFLLVLLFWFLVVS